MSFATVTFLLMAILTVVADVGQEEDFETARKKALKIGAVAVYVEDLRKEFVEELIYPAIQCNAIYEVHPFKSHILTLGCLSPRNFTRPSRHCSPTNPNCGEGGLQGRLSRLHRQRQ